MMHLLYGCTLHKQQREADKRGKMIEACSALHASESCRHHASNVIPLHREGDDDCDPRAVPVQFAETEEAVREADKWSKIVEARLKEAQSKGQLSDELKAQSDEARRLEIEARNEAKCAPTPVTCMLCVPSVAYSAWPKQARTPRAGNNQCQPCLPRSYGCLHGSLRGMVPRIAG